MVQYRYSLIMRGDRVRPKFTVHNNTVTAASLSAVACDIDIDIE